MTVERAPLSAASIRARLENNARARGIEFQLVLSDWAIERFLYRLGISKHAGAFALKGAMLFRLWTAEKGRATWDLDLHGHHRDGIRATERVIREICALGVEDGIAFDVAAIRGEAIRGAQEEGGVRVRLEARLGNARIPVQIDIGFGDAITPPAVAIQYPTLLPQQQAPRVLAYPREAVIAEKVEAMISLGLTNSRMKDFFDVRTLASMYPFDGALLAAAIRATFERRGTPLPMDEPVVLSRQFLDDAGRAAQWRAFLKRGRLAAPTDAGEVADDLRAFVGPVLRAASRGDRFERHWEPGGPWR